MGEMLEKAIAAIAADADHLDPAKCNENDIAWLAAQLACWPARVDPECTTNMRFLMTSAAAFIVHFAPSENPS